MDASPFFDGWRHCPRCAAALDIDGRSASCPACGLKVYANPAPTASVVVVDEEGRVLLARRAGDPGAGLWDLPGGYMEEGEDPLATLRREIAEETSLEIEPGDFVGGFPDRYGEGGVYTINFYWAARAAGGELELDGELAEVAWFAPHELPSREEFAFANTVEALDAWRRLGSKGAEK